MGKRLGRRLTERLNGGGAAAENSGEGNGAPRAGQTNNDGVCRGVLRVETEEGKRGRGRGLWGSGNLAGAWRKRGTSKGGGSLPIGGRRPTGSGPRPAGVGDVRRARAASRIEGEGRG
jgi:hypothetical protein